MTDLRFQPGSIEQLRIDQLRPYARNPRTHSDDQVAKLAASLVEFGWTMPVLVNDELEVIAGHGRILAARRLGLDAVPVIRLAHLSPEQVRAYRIADNRLSELSGWDDELLAAELQALSTPPASIWRSPASRARTWAGCWQVLSRATVWRARTPSPSRRPTRYRAAAICGCWAGIACCVATAPGPRMSSG